jgi:DNA-binding transcriptional ArsR family regulator
MASTNSLKQSKQPEPEPSAAPEQNWASERAHTADTFARRAQIFNRSVDNWRGATIVNQVVENKAEADVDAVFHALANNTRREMLGRLAQGELTVGELAEPFSMSLEAASKHVKALERAGLVHRRVDGRRHVCRLVPGPLASAHAWLSFYERYWSDRLDALEVLFQDAATEAKEK